MITLTYLQAYLLVTALSAVYEYCQYWSDDSNQEINCWPVILVSSFGSLLWPVILAAKIFVVLLGVFNINVRTLRRWHNK